MKENSINLIIDLIRGFKGEGLSGLFLNLSLAFCSCALAMVVSFLLGFVIWARIPFLSRFIDCAFLLVRCVPLLIFLFFMNSLCFSFFGLGISMFKCCIYSLTIYSSSYLVEILKGGFLITNRGQVEYATLCGFNKIEIILKIMLPQAIRYVKLPLFSFFIGLYKDTSAVYVVGLVDIVQVCLIKSENQPQSIFLFYISTGFVFLVTSFCLQAILSIIFKENTSI